MLTIKMPEYTVSVKASETAWLTHKIEATAVDYRDGIVCFVTGAPSIVGGGKIVACFPVDKLLSIVDRSVERS